MVSKLRHWQWIFLLAVTLAAAAGSGCSTTDVENLSERPWNAPKNWEHGIPTGIMEGR